MVRVAPGFSFSKKSNPSMHRLKTICRQPNVIQLYPPPPRYTVCCVTHDIAQSLLLIRKPFLKTVGNGAPTVIHLLEGLGVDCEGSSPG